MVHIPLFGRGRSVLDTPRLLYDRKTRLPKLVQVGGHKIPPLVRVEDLQDHLTLLLAFHNLQAALDDLESQCEVLARQYLHFSTSTKDVNEAMPSLGVLMCWHAHMLNPRRYDRECEGYLEGLKGRSFPLKQAAQAIRDGTLLPTPPSVSSTPTLDLPRPQPLDSWTASDIAAAVIRQKKFIDNMARIGWLEEGYGDDKYSLVDLQKSIVRYHAWLDLMHSVRGKEFLVPTLDIDLAWHTHQLSGRGYKTDTGKLLGMFLNHDDAAGEGKIGNGLTRTSELWKTRYGREYTY